MNYGLHELLLSCGALAVLPVFFLAPGYLAASLTNLMQFRRASWLERLLWATALSLPLSLQMAVHPGLPLSPHLTTVIFVAIALGALVRGFLSDRDKKAPVRWDGSAKVGALVAAALVPYVLLSVVPIELHGRIFESNVWQDWNIRIQLVNAAIRGGNAPGNPMFALQGKPAALHYYFYWYILCARMHDLVPASARAILTVSCAGSGLSLLAFLLLAIKYLSPQKVESRRPYLGALLVAAMLGLDVVNYTLGWLHGRFYSDLQFWLNDHNPGWLHLMLWSPHHVGGFVCCGLALLLTLCSLQVSRPQQVVHAIVAGICLAASVGTSTFITLLFAFVFLALVLDAARTREWRFVQTVTLASVLSVALAGPFLKGVLLAPVPPLTVPGAPAQTATKSPPPIHLGLRYNNQAMFWLWTTMRRFDSTLQHSPSVGDPNFNRIKWQLRLLRPPVLLYMLVCDFGFLLFVLVAQFRKDFRRGEPLARSARVLWIYLAGVSVPGFLLNSGNGLMNNDLGRDAGFCVRFVLLLWSAPMVAEFLERRRAARAAGVPMRCSRAIQGAVVFAVLGLISQAAQIVLVRTRFMLTAAGLVPQAVVEERLFHPAYRFDQVRKAMDAADHVTPATGIVQGNPHSKLRNVFLLYTNRQMAALDDGCNVPFGGALADCTPMSLDLIQLFGGMGHRYHGEQGVFSHYTTYDPAATTTGNFNALCARYRLNTVVASFVDPAWWHRDSWIWQVRPVYENSTARVFTCPESGKGPHA